MKKTALTLVAVAATVLAGCGKSTGQKLGSLWVAHNSTTAIVTELGDGPDPVLSVADLKEFQSYQVPVLEGLNSATEDYIAGEDADVLRTLEYIDPLLDRMVEITEKEAD